MKILYVACKYDPLNIDSGSSMDFELYHAFLRGNVKTEIVGPFVEERTIFSKVAAKIDQVVGKRSVKYSTGFLKSSGRSVDKAILETKPDLVFSYFAAPLAYSLAKVPLCYMIDTTLMESQEQWPIFSKSAYQSMLQWEKRVILRAARVICLSDSSKEKLISGYGVAPQKIHVIPMPASIPEDVIPKKIDLSKRMGEPVHLLTVGREFSRKGIDLAIEITEKLNSIGCPTELRIIGLNGVDTEFVRFMGLFKKGDPAQLRDYAGNYSWADLLLHPARFEAAGIVPSEAAAFGVPTITQSVGGLETTVKDGISGIVMPKNSAIEIYVEKIIDLKNNQEKYMDLCRSTRDRYDHDLNWQVAGKKIVNIAKEISGKSEP